jgi:peptidyl-prolyl cis-trans isomerase A (cyclophilin A)
MIRFVLAVLLLALPLLAAGCAQEQPAPPPTASAVPAAQAAPPPAAPPAADLPAPDPALLNPAGAAEQAPAQYTVKLETTQGDILIDVHRDWSPNGADRFYNLVKLGYFQDVAFFRVISGFMAQVGIHGDPRVNAQWREANIQDDPVKQSNTRGMVTFAMSSQPNSRTTQFFISFKDNSNLDPMGFAPFGQVRDMAVVDKLYSGYGEGAPRGRGPNQGKVQMIGNPYLRAEFPKLDYIVKASLVE